MTHGSSNIRIKNVWVHTLWLCILTYSGIHAMQCTTHTGQKNNTDTPTYKTSTHTVVRNAIFGTTSLAMTGIGLALPYKTVPQINRMRTYFLGAMAGETLGSVAKNIPLPNSQETYNRAKMTIDIGYALWNIPFIDIARRLPMQQATHIRNFRAYSAFCLLSQGFGTIFRDSCAPYCATAYHKIITFSQRTSSTLDEQRLATLDLY